MEETESKEENKVDNVKSKIKSNPWMVSSIVLGAVCLVLIIITLKPGLTGNVVKEDVAGAQLVDYLNSMTGGGVEFISSQDLGGLYQVMVLFEEQEIPVYITKDGKYFIQGVTPITGDAVDSSQGQQQQPAEVPKSDKPTLDLFVFSYCPYGTQAEKALLPVYNILKNKADINLVFIGAMHGEYERQESLRQICIQKLYGKDKLFSYLEKFLGDTRIGDCNGNDACLAPLLSSIYSQLGINKANIENCMKAEGISLYNADTAKAEQLGIGGSPGFLINGAEVQVARSPAGIKDAICYAFNTPPGECSQALSDQPATPGFGYGSGGEASSGASCE